MDPLALASRRLFIPVFDRLRGISDPAISRAVRRGQFLPESTIRSAQLARLQELLSYVYEHNRFYRSRFEEIGATPNDFASLADLSRFPILRKTDIRQNLQMMISDGFRPENLLRRRTGGSTGEPIQLYQDRGCQALKEALVRRHDSWAGFLPGEKRAALWGNIKPPKGIARRIFNVLALRTEFLDTLQMDDGNMHAFADMIARTGTRLLFGHGHSLYYFARFQRDKRREKLSLDGIISSAETLPPEERKVVEEEFGNIVFDRYGCEEIGLIASECEKHDGMHTAAEGVYIEILDGDEEQPGRVIVTDLINRGTPLIRYEIGDLAATKPDPCPCGRGLPRIGRLFGRTSDILYTPEGKSISGISILDSVMIHIPGFRQVQVVQEKIDELVFNIVRDTSFSEESLNLLARSVPEYFGPTMRYRVNLVESIPLTGRGKFKCSICKLDPRDVP